MSDEPKRLYHQEVVDFMIYLQLAELHAAIQYLRYERQRMDD